ncbi:unnamed protein product [Enterobius vermicularis]|uniref:PINc domain-containing protein n=1 Tax=Enterobius vermicularis TaxID=51028 RepID=A0A158Q9N5_ENTVE|nr:unnamed protein product [Enterobius vermicularis]
MSSRKLFSEEEKKTQMHLQRLARPLLNDSKYRQRVLEALWKSSFYSLICCMRGASLNDQQKGWCDMQISILVGEMTRISIEFPDLQNAVSIYLGDLRRSVAEMDNGGGIVYNQLGLLVQDSEPIKALLYFFLAYSFPNRPFHGAFANILGLLAKKTAILDDPVVAVIEHCLTTFSRYEFQDLMTTGLEHIQSQLDTKDAFYVSCSVSLLILAVLALFSKDKQNEARSVIEMLLKTAEDTLKTLEEWTPIKISGSRRRRASEAGKERSDNSSSESFGVEEDNDEGVVELDSDDGICMCGKIGEFDGKFTKNKDEQEMQMLQVALLHFAVSTAPYIYNGKSAPAAMKHQYEVFCQNMCRHLNEANYGLSSSTHLPLWYLGTSDSFKLLPRFLEEFAMAEDTPVHYECYFRFITRSAREELLMKNMAKMRLIHETKEEEARAWVPVYVVPEKEVLIQRPGILKGIVKNSKIIVVIAEDTLREMDKLKKEKAGAREAIRFIENQVSDPARRLRIENSSSVQECAEKLASQTQLTDAVIVVILTMSKIDNKTVPRCNGLKTQFVSPQSAGGFLCYDLVVETYQKVKETSLHLFVGESVQNSKNISWWHSSRLQAASSSFRSPDTALLQLDQKLLYSGIETSNSSRAVPVKSADRHLPVVQQIVDTDGNTVSCVLAVEKLDFPRQGEVGGCLDLHNLKLHATRWNLMWYGLISSPCLKPLFTVGLERKLE